MAGKRQSTEHKVGTCVCGRDINLGDRYSVSTTGPTTIKRVCQGYGCGRVNEIVLKVNAEVFRATWKAHECLCGAPIYLRSDYAGPNFEGWEGTGFRAMIANRDDYKNRTVKTACRGCACRYVIKIRFVRGDDNRWERDWRTSVYRCRPCKARKERLENAS